PAAHASPPDQSWIRRMIGPAGGLSLVVASLVAMIMQDHSGLLPLGLVNESARTYRLLSLALVGVVVVVAAAVCRQFWALPPDPSGHDAPQGAGVRPSRRAPAGCRRHRLDQPGAPCSSGRPLLGAAESSRGMGVPQARPRRITVRIPLSERAGSGAERYAPALPRRLVYRG